MTEAGRAHVDALLQQDRDEGTRLDATVADARDQSPVAALAPRDGGPERFVDQSGSWTRAVRGPERFGDRIADRVATFGGRWTVISGFCGALPVWTAVSVLLAIRAEDPFPFIFPGLILSCVAARQAPVIVMSRPRQKEKDRERSQDDCPVNLKAEVENRLLHEKPDHLLIGHSAHLEAMQGMIPDRAEWALGKA